ncbi:hypothetical protein, partial [Geobacillus thermoleovorans]|uniref:hypothetical protein n=1 Tax=Geobacillus thermoleovorans TaxID=33941 RepID=UPI003DA4AE82
RQRVRNAACPKRFPYFIDFMAQFACEHGFYVPPCDFQSLLYTVFDTKRGRKIRFMPVDAQEDRECLSLWNKETPTVLCMKRESFTITVRGTLASVVDSQ